MTPPVLIVAPPALVAASHGTSDRAGQRAVRSLVAAVAESMPATRVIGGYVDVQQPDVPACLGDVADSGAVVIVPLLLSTGYHVRVDLAEAARDAAPRPVIVTDALGPDERITGILAERLDNAGLRDGDRVVLAAAGSSDKNAVADCRRVGESLAARLGRPVLVGFISAAQPRLADAVNTVRAETPDARVVIATYLLAPGYFAGLTHAVGADIVTAPLLAEGEEPPAGLVDVVVDLYTRAAAQVVAHVPAPHVSAVFRRPISAIRIP